MGNREFILYLFYKLGEIKGKKALQKLVYLARIFDIETSYSYRFHYFGPYSDALARDLDDLLENDIIGIKPDSNYIMIAKESNIGKELINRSDILKADKLIHFFGKMAPSELELFSTAYFIDRDEKYVFGNQDEEKIILEIMKAKPRFAKTKIRETYDQLKKWGFLYNG